MDIVSNIKVEGTIYRRDGVVIPRLIYDVVKPYIIVEAEEKVIFQVPLDWDGFKNDVAVTIGRSELDVYFALAYFTSGDDMVVDFEGFPINSYDSVLDGVRVRKFVKRTLCIIRKVSEKNSVFEAEAFSLKIQYPEPLVRLMRMSCYGKDGLSCLKNIVGVLLGDK